VQPTQLRASNKEGTDFSEQKPDDETSKILSCGLACLDELKAEDVVVFDVRGHSTVSDMIVIASGRSRRHVGVLAEKMIQALKQEGVTRLFVEGKSTCNWVLIDVGNVIFHIFVPEVRGFYQLEKMWAQACKKTYMPINGAPPSLDHTLSHSPEPGPLSSAHF